MRKQTKSNESQKQFIGYARVSTQEQGAKQNSIPKQVDEIQKFFDEKLKSKGELVGIYSDISSGKRISRPEFDKVLNFAKEKDATIIVHKLDRLGRSIGVLSKLQALKVSVLFADSPNDSEFITNVKMAFAQEERRLISERTKHGLEQVKAKGKKLGWHNPKVRNGLKKAWKERKKALKASGDAPKRHHHKATDAMAFAERMRPTIQLLIEQGLTIRGIVDRLNDDKLRSKAFREGKWHLRQVQLVLKRLGLKTQRATA